MYVGSSPKHLRLIVKLNLTISNQAIHWDVCLASTVHDGPNLSILSVSHEAIESDLFLIAGETVKPSLTEPSHIRRPRFAMEQCGYLLVVSSRSILP